MKINVIGGSGFVGTRLCKSIKAKNVHSFSIVDKVTSKSFPELSTVADVRDVTALNSAIDYGSVIINLAAEHRDDVTPKSLYHDVNVTGAENICHVAREKNITKIIFTSSVAVYGFAPQDTDENGAINPFNEYGKTKYAAEQVFRKWQSEKPDERCLVIIRPTVIFGEQNRGNVYNLLKQIASGKFVMIGNGRNSKSMAYVQNIADFITHSVSFPAGLHIYNYIDKPDFNMNELVSVVKNTLGRGNKVGIRMPYSVGYAIGKIFDFASIITTKKFPISSIRVKKFCSDSKFSTSVSETGFKPSVSLSDGLNRTVKYEFLEDHANEQLFYSE
ncbi:NAD-dependent epimerase/dehydratase family protein [Undibacterium squillarum]|uniref:Epimerase n=1 Tax=Undibacterium squillarum TaxID=1131567 RepID=A0ABQ2XV34_9BURK|nr:NAD-dependent epimerase/dehydratase family protein [Undibacterium squillarum]GGX34507.1 epimerase [Undibacterium squillarum]